MPSPLVSFNPAALLGKPLPVQVKAASAGDPACVAADLIAMGTASASVQGCDIFSDTLPSVETVTDCMGKMGLSTTCEACLTNSLTTILNCLTSCDYNNGEISQNPSQQCVTCMTDLMSHMGPDSNMLAPCGLDTADMDSVVSQMTPQDGASEASTTQAASTTDASVTTTTTKTGRLVRNASVLTVAILALLTAM